MLSCLQKLLDVCVYCQKAASKNLKDMKVEPACNTCSGCTWMALCHSGFSGGIPGGACTPSQKCI